MKKIILFFTFLYFSVTSVVFAQNSHPNNLVTSLITSTSAELSWNGADVHKIFYFHIDPFLDHGHLQAGNITVTNPHQLTGLLAGAIMNGGLSVKRADGLQFKVFNHRRSFLELVLMDFV